MQIHLNKAVVGWENTFLSTSRHIATFESFKQEKYVQTIDEHKNEPPMYIFNVNQHLHQLPT